MFRYPPLDRAEGDMIQSIGEHTHLLCQILDHTHGEGRIFGEVFADQFTINGNQLTRGQGNSGGQAREAIEERGFAKEATRFKNRQNLLSAVLRLDIALDAPLLQKIEAGRLTTLHIDSKPGGAAYHRPVRHDRQP